MPVKAPPQPTQFGSYEVLDTIGRGGMGTVYRGRDIRDGRLVALKVVNPQLAVHTVLCRRFEQEFQAARQLKHPNIVQGLDFGVEGTTPYFVMELVEGGSLWSRINHDGPMPEAEAVRVAVQVAQALELVHRHNYIHRDIKPDNILLTTAGDAKLTDLGLVKSLDADVNLTQGNDLIGTPHYAAPEQFDDPRGVDVRADVYGLGATLYSAVTGRLPFEVRGKQHYPAVLKKKILNELVPPRQIVPLLSEALDFAIRRATRSDRTQRHASCAEFIMALTGRSKPDITPPDRSRRGEATSRKERRAAVRFETALDSRCEPVGIGREKHWSARIEDISVSGLRLILPRRFEPGTVLAVEIKSPDKKSQSIQVVKVMRVCRDKPRQWLLGCSFLRPLNAAELRAIL